VLKKTLVELDEALAWARGEKRMQVRLPDGASLEMGVKEYCTEYETQERLRAHRGAPTGSALHDGGAKSALTEPRPDVFRL
jgi:hypothetical protein